MSPVDSFRCRRDLPGFTGVSYMSLPEAERAGAGPLGKLPYSLRVLADNLLRNEDGRVVTTDHILALTGARSVDVAFHPSRILMQDSSGLPVLGDLAAFEEAVAQRGGGHKAKALRADLVVDHSIEVDHWASPEAAKANIEREYIRNADRYRFLRWAEERFDWLRVVPPGEGICHQLNLERLADVVFRQATPCGEMAGCDSLLGTDSHTPMVNALGVFGWGVGGIEATAALLGQPVVMAVPAVVGVRLTGRLRPGVTATDLALSMTATLRPLGLVQCIVEYFGPGLDALSVPDRATLANMAPEYGATMGFFPADMATLAYLRATGRPPRNVDMAEAFLTVQGLLRTGEDEGLTYSRTITFELGEVEPTVAGPSRPEQRRALSEVPATAPTAKGSGAIDHGSVAIAAITSCTNTSNPKMLVTAGLLARNAVAKGLQAAPWVKTSFAPGSRAAADVLVQSGLQTSLDALGFNLVGFGCTTCMGNSGALDPKVTAAITEGGLSAAAVISGNRNFEGRVHPLCKLAYLASPPLVVAYAIAGTVQRDLSTQAVGADRHGTPVMLSDIWPSDDDVAAALAAVKHAQPLTAEAADSHQRWHQIQPSQDKAYDWEREAGFIRRPPFLEQEVIRPLANQDILGARALVLLGDDITTDHISPVARILPGSEAARWLDSFDVPASAYTSYSARRLNHDVMIRGGFANPELANALAKRRGGFTTVLPDNRPTSIFDAAKTYVERGVPMIVLGGARYGGGSARDWAAKVTRLLGISAVIAESFERIHRTNLAAMGVLPLQISRQDRLRLTGSETFDITGLGAGLKPGDGVTMTVHGRDGSYEAPLICRLETQAEREWIAAGGILPFVLNKSP